MYLLKWIFKNPVTKVMTVVVIFTALLLAATSCGATYGVEQVSFPVESSIDVGSNKVYHFTIQSLTEQVMRECVLVETSSGGSVAIDCSW